MAASGPAAGALEPPGLDGTRRENLVLRELVALYHHLTALALQSPELEPILRLLADRTGALVAVVGPGHEILAAAVPGLGHDESAERAGATLTPQWLRRSLHAVARTRRPLRVPGADREPGVVVAPILVGDQILAYLLSVGSGGRESGEDLSLLLTEHAATICGVVMGRDRVVAAAAGRVRDDLLEGLLLGRSDDAEELRRWARHLGYDAGSPHRVASVVLEDRGPEDGPRRKRVFHALAHFAARRAPDAIVAVREEEVVLVVLEREAAEVVGDCLARARSTFPDAVLTTGLGGACGHPGEIARAYAQARRTVEAVRRLGRTGQMVAFADLGIHRLLLQIPELAQLRSFAEEVIGRLIEYERAHHSGYLETLAIYFHENGSLQGAARRLHVHVNTVTYRLHRIEQIAGLDLGRYQDRLMAQVALEVLEAIDA
jgi:PucR C-terminal helix-turn-helix domain/GGDEF-like domain